MATQNPNIRITAEDDTKRGIDSASGRLRSLAGEAGGLANELTGMSAGFVALGGAIAGAFSVAAIKGGIDILDQMDEMAEKTGISVEALSALRYAGEVVGVPITALADGIKKLTINMSAAAGGGKEQIAAFNALGVSFKNLDGSLRGSDAMIGDLADKFASFRDGPEKAALAMEIFGKSGDAMIPILNKGSQGIAELREEAQKLGTVFESDMAASAAEFNDNLTKIKLVSEGAAATMAGQLLPTLNTLANTLLEAGENSNGFATTIGQGLKTALEAVSVVVANVTFVFQVAGLELGAYWARLDALRRLDFTGFSAIGDAVKEDSARARKELDALEKKILDVGKSAAGAGRGTGIDARIIGSVGSIKEQADALKTVAPILKKTGDAAKATADEFAKLWDKLSGKASGTDADFAKNIDLLSTGYSKGRITLEEYTGAVLQYIALQPYAIEAAKAELKIVEERQALRTKENAGIDAWMQSQQDATAKALASATGRVESLQAEEQAAALAAAQNISLALAVEMVSIARMEEQQATKYIEGGEAWQAIQIEIDKRRELLGLIANKDARETAEKTAKDAADEWAKAADQINQSLSDALMNGFSAGKGFAKSFVDSVKAMFNTMVLRPVISAIVNPVASAITGGLGLASTGASAASGAGGVSDMLGLGKMAASIGGTFAEFGTTLLASTQTAIGMTATAAQASSAAIMGAAAQTGSLIGSLGPLITAAPYIAAIAGVYLLAKKLDHSGTLHTGAGSGYSASGGLQSAAGGDIFDGGFTGIKYSDQTAQMTDGIVKGIVDILDSTAVTFGQTAGHAAATSFADDTSKDGAWGSLVITQLGQVMTDWAASAGSNKREFSDGSAGTQEYLAAISADVRTALDGIGLPAWATAMLDELGNAPSLEQLSATAQAINTTQAALVQMGDKLTGFADLSDGAVAALIKAAGGIGALAASASSYYDNFYTDGEKTANTLAGITDALAAVGQTTPATREAFRAQVEYLQSIADTEPAAAPALAALLGVSGAFATIVPATEAASVAAAGSAAGIASLSTALDALRSPIRSIEDVANSIFKLEGEGSALQIELLKTYGDSASMAEASRLQREAETAGMTAQEVALYSLNATRRAEIDAIEAARLATADGVASWENYFSMFGTDAEKQSRAKTRVAAVLAPDIDTAEEYRAAVYLLTEQFGVGSAEVKRVTDVAGDFAIAFPTVAESIAEVTATAVTLDKALATLSSSDAARTVEQIAGSMLSLKEQAYQLTNAGNTPALRARTLAGLSSAPDATGATEQSLQQTVWDLQDLGEAAKVADAALKSNTASYAAWSDAMASPDEKKAAATARINALFGSGVDSMDAYRAAVEKLADTYGIGSDQVRLATDAAGDFAIAFPAVADAISAVSDTVVTLEQALAALSGSNAARTVDQIAGSMVSLQDQLFGIVNAGDTEALRKKTRAGLSSVQVNDQSELSLQNDVWSAQDAAARAGERAGLQQQLDLLNGVTTARDLEREALNETNQALFDQVTAAQYAKTASEALAAAEKTAADERTAAASAVAAERAGLQQQLDLLTGVTTARAVERAALDESNRALYDQVEAAQAAKTASDALAEAEKSAADERTAAAKAASDERAGLQQQLDLLTGVTTARDLERASLDETNRALFDQVESAQAAKTAAEELAAAEKVVADERDAAAKAVASERAGLQEQLSLLTGVTTARELERAALDEANRALYDQVTAAQAAKTASEALAEADKVAAGERDAAAKAVASERAGLQQQLDLINGVTTARDLERAALDESNRALFDQVTAAQSAKTAAEELAAAEKLAADERTAAANAVTSERAGLQQQLDLLAGVTTARDLERAALDETNRALFDQVTAAQAAKDAADQLSASMNGLSAIGASLEIELQRALGNVDLADAMQTAIDTAGMTEAELALYDYNQALRDQIEAANAASDAAAQAQAAADAAANEAADALQRIADAASAAAQQIAQERDGMARQLLQLQGDTAALRALDLAAIDPANRALQEHIWALEDEKTAAEQAAAASKAIADERIGLEQQLMQLQGDTAGLRALELAALDPSNRALQEQVWALEDLQSATEATTTAWESLTDSLMKEVDRIRGVMAESSTDSTAALQSRFAIATAQARAGDQDAAGNLAGYSSALLAAAADDAGSRIELIRLQAQIAASLQTTANLMGAGPGATAPLQGASLNQVVAVASNTQAPANEKLEALVVQLTAEITDLKRQMSSIQQNTRRTADAVNGAGEAPMIVEVDA